MRVLVVSDLHLGDGSRADDFGDNDASFIDWHRGIKQDLTVFNGDFCDLWQFGYERIYATHTRLFEYIAGINAKFIIGNHDYKLLGSNQLELTLDDGRRVLIIHGHQADERMSTPCVRLGVWMLGMLERLPGLHWIDNPECFLKTSHSEAVQKVSAFVEEQFDFYDIVVCGHTHLAMKTIKGYTGSHIYINTGSCMHGNFCGSVIDTRTGLTEAVANLDRRTYAARRKPRPFRGGRRFKHHR